MFRRAKLSLLLLIALLFTLPAAAQDGMGELTIIASGLNHPRQLFYAPDGTLYIAEAGTGGDIEATGAMGNPVMTGLTAQVSAVSPDGEVAVILPEQFSADLGFGSLYGVHAVYVDGDSLWVAHGEGIPLENVPARFGTPQINSIAEYDLATGELRRASNALDYETINNPDGDVDNISSNPVDLALGADGVLYIANAGCNCVMQWTQEAGLGVFHAWTPEDNPVPTTVAVAPDGNVYVSFLTGFPFPEGGSRIEVWTPEGELVTTYEGLTGVVDVLVGADGAIYAVQHGVFGNMGWTENTGSVVSVSADGITPILEGLNRPYGLAQDANGNLVVSVNSAGSEAGSGAVIAVPMM